MTTVFQPSKRSLILVNVLSQTDLSHKKVLDVGTGNGILAITAGQMGAAAVTATDINPEALTATRQNWIQSKLSIPLTTLTCGSLTTLLSNNPCGQFDTIISNPPMLPTLCCKNKSKKRGHHWNETGNNGRQVVDELITVGPKLLQPGGKLIFSHSSRLGFDQTKKLLAKNFPSWKILFEAKLKLEPRFKPFLHFWTSDSRKLTKSGGNFLETFCIIEAVNHGQN